jgi:hypothetical protein
MVPAFVAAEAWLGIRLSDRVNSERNTTKGNAQKDVLVSYVERSSPAAKAGLQVDVPEAGAIAPRRPQTIRAEQRRLSHSPARLFYCIPRKNLIICRLKVCFN